MGSCNHEEWIRIYPNRCWIEKKVKKIGVSHTSNQIKTIVIKICTSCKKIIEVKDYGK
jgi:hypothetical protein